MGNSDKPNFNTPGNRNPEARYRGYKGEPLRPVATDDEREAWAEGDRARIRGSRMRPHNYDDESIHFMACNNCGAPFDKRNLDEVMHHEGDCNVL